ncbi:hypothetical protein [Cryobacterium sp. PH31-L1]|uniref:hypothetical protein n=1 Tax=Cryobacterium sp. PH31-L1 TaxID=3046199 RepID=UPI0024BA278A|nr:hypothetical protein [Cryobacterium sp. PH31-L1]MDJ0379112.1 hypothetical protein [Cryobacterium sp. PH31-L1]
MKKLIAPIVLVAALSLTGCGATDAAPVTTSPAASSEAKPVEAAPIAPDLTGGWKQSNSQSETDFMTATIVDGVISIDWELGSEDITAVYWVGTFEGPADANATHTWTSQRNAAETDNALMASTDNTKEFTYEDGLISYSVSIQGESATVELKHT